MPETQRGDSPQGTGEESRSSKICRSAVQQLKGEAAKRNDAFEKSFASHKGADKVREKKFEELLKLAKEDKSDTPPKRAFDLD